jgi:hypothetical protein
MLSGSVTLTGTSGEGIAIRADVLAGIQQASASTGIDFSYLMAQANRESSFDPTAQAKSSSAAGLYQFIEQTWLGVVKAHGAEYGRADLADQIAKRSDGRFVVSDPAVRQQILDLRRDPAFAASMAAEHAADNKAKLEDKLGREANGTDLYMAHFLGISGAIKFLRAQAETPDRTGASLFPKAAAANPAVFYTAEGRARSLDEIYARFDQRINADMETYASLETSGVGAEAEITEAVASAPDIQSAKAGAIALAYLNGNTATNSTSTQNSPEIRGFSRVGGLLSPLMLVTLAALPVGKDDAKDDQPKSLFGNDRSSGTGSSLFDQDVFGNSRDPLGLERMRSAFAL